jgi:hypothetical protein
MMSVVNGHCTITCDESDDVDQVDVDVDVAVDADVDYNRKVDDYTLRQQGTMTYHNNKTPHRIPINRNLIVLSSSLPITTTTASATGNTTTNTTNTIGTSQLFIYTRYNVIFVPNFLVVLSFCNTHTHTHIYTHRTNQYMYRIYLCYEKDEHYECCDG